MPGVTVRRLALSALVAVVMVCSAVALARSAGSGGKRSGGVTGQPGRIGRSSYPARRVYAAEGVTLVRPRAPIATTVTRREAILRFERQDFAVRDWSRAELDAGLYMVTERNPVYLCQRPGIKYPAWVVTVDHAPSLSTGGPAGGPQQLHPPYDCRNVAIFDLNISKWTEFFQTCGPTEPAHGGDARRQRAPAVIRAPTPLPIRIEKTAYTIAGFAGDTLTREHVMIVYVTPSAIQAMGAALSRAGIPRTAYRLVAVAHSLRALQALTRRLASQEARLGRQGIHLIQWGPDAASNTVVADISSYSIARATALQNDYEGPGWITVKPWQGPAHAELY